MGHKKKSPFGDQRKCEETPAKKYKNAAKDEKSESEIFTYGSNKKSIKDVYTDSSSSSESTSDVDKNQSNSNSDSESDSDSSGTEETETSEKVKSVPATMNSVVNKHPIKTYTPPKSSGSESYHSDTEEEDKKRRKKQKELMKQKQKKRNTPKRTDSTTGETDEDLKDDDDDYGQDLRGWNAEDVRELISRMKEQIPDDDTQKFDSRAARLDWDRIAFKNYNKQECQNMWNHMSKRIRRFRKLSEMLEDAKEWVDKPWMNFYRGAKGNRHPDLPSKPLPAYVIFYLEQKERISEENEGMSLAQISKIVSDMYKNLSDKEREKYYQKAAMEKQHFDEKLAEFYREHPDYEPQPQVKSTRDIVKGPKKPNTPFKLYLQEELKKYGGSADKKALEESAKEKWKKFNDSKKAEWLQRALDGLKRFEREIESHKAKNPDYVVPNYNKSILNKEERLIMERLSGKPLKPPNSAYSLFSRHMLQSDGDVKSKAPKLRMAEISKKWKEISVAEKNRYEQRVKELQEEYKAKLQRYLKSLTPEEREREFDIVKKQKRKKKEKSTRVPKNKKGTVKSKSKSKTPEYQFYDGEPKPPPAKVYDLFVQRFLKDRPANMSEEARLKQVPEYWEKLPDSKKESLKNELDMLKKKYFADYSAYLKSLSSDDLKKLSAMKVRKEDQVKQINGTLTDSNEESEDEKCESSSEDSDSDDSDSGKSDSSSDDSDG